MATVVTSLASRPHRMCHHTARSMKVVMEEIRMCSSDYHLLNLGLTMTREIPVTIDAEGLVEIYFTHFHRNPYDILDEEVTRNKLRTNQLPKSVLYAICAVTTRYTVRAITSAQILLIL